MIAHRSNFFTEALILHHILTANTSCYTIFWHDVLFLIIFLFVGVNMIVWEKLFTICVLLAPFLFVLKCIFSPQKKLLGKGIMYMSHSRCRNDASCVSGGGVVKTSKTLVYVFRLQRSKFNHCSYRMVYYFTLYIV